VPFAAGITYLATTIETRVKSASNTPLKDFTSASAQSLGSSNLGKHLAESVQELEAKTDGEHETENKLEL